MKKLFDLRSFTVLEWFILSWLIVLGIYGAAFRT